MARIDVGENAETMIYKNGLELLVRRIRLRRRCRCRVAVQLVSLVGRLGGDGRLYDGSWGKKMTIDRPGDGKLIFVCELMGRYEEQRRVRYPGDACTRARDLKISRRR